MSQTALNELKKISKTFRQIASRLLSTDYESADLNLKRLIEYINNNPVLIDYINDVIETFTKNNPNYELKGEGDRTGHYGRFIFPTSLEGEIACTWTLLNEINDSEYDLLRFAMGYSSPRGKFQDEIDSFNKNVINPFVNHLIHHLEDKIEEAKNAEQFEVAPTYSDDFMAFLRPLAKEINLDSELTDRCLTHVSGNANDPKAWDSALRNAGVVLENRMRKVGKITDSSLVGAKLVNALFTDKGVLAHKFQVESERQGFRDLYAGAIGTMRNPSAHKFIDPIPEEGGAYLMFINLLLKKLDELSK